MNDRHTRFKNPWTNEFNFYDFLGGELLYDFYKAILTYYVLDFFISARNFFYSLTRAYGRNGRKN